MPLQRSVASRLIMRSDVLQSLRVLQRMQGRGTEVT